MAVRARKGAWKKNKWNAEEDEKLKEHVMVALENEKKKGDKKKEELGEKIGRGEGSSGSAFSVDLH